MKKKTVLQLLIDQLNKELQQPLGVMEDHRAYHSKGVDRAIKEIKEINKRIDQATELLETEREQIEDSHANGIHDAAECAAGREFRTSGQYYKDTYQ